jgi:hypothetical protein
MAKSATKSTAAPKRKVATKPAPTARAKRAVPKRAAASSPRKAPALKTKVTTQRFTASRLNEKDFTPTRWNCN